MSYSRCCKFCEDIFQTEKKYGCVCGECRDKNHKKKVMRNLFNGNSIE